MRPFVKIWISTFAMAIAPTAVLVGQTTSPTVPALETAAKEAEQAGLLQEAFDLYVRAVQALPDPPLFETDLRFRERIIVLSAQTEPRPVAPQDAERFSIRGLALFKDAKNEDDVEAASEELRKAVRAAPWAPDLAYNLAERNTLAAAKEKCKRGNDEGCEDLGRLGGGAWAHDDYKTAYPALKLACEESDEGCDTLGFILIVADMADQTRAKWATPDVHGADALKSMGVSPNPVEGISHLIEACHHHPQECFKSLTQPYVVSAGMERDFSGKIVRTDSWYDLAWNMVTCPGRNKDCLMKGILAEYAIGTRFRKADRNAAKKFYESACASGVTVACDRRKELGR